MAGRHLPESLMGSPGDRATLISEASRLYEVLGDKKSVQTCRRTLMLLEETYHSQAPTVQCWYTKELMQIVWYILYWLSCVDYLGFLLYLSFFHANHNYFLCFLREKNRFVSKLMIRLWFVHMFNHVQCIEFLTYWCAKYWVGELLCCISWFTTLFNILNYSDVLLIFSTGKHLLSLFGCIYCFGCTCVYTLY